MDPFIQTTFFQPSRNIRTSYGAKSYIFIPSAGDCLSLLNEFIFRKNNLAFSGPSALCLEEVTFVLKSSDPESCAGKIENTPEGTFYCDGRLVSNFEPWFSSKGIAIDLFMMKETVGKQRPLILSIRELGRSGVTVLPSRKGSLAVMIHEDVRMELATDRRGMPLIKCRGYPNHLRESKPNTKMPCRGTTIRLPNWAISAVLYTQSQLLAEQDQ